jgi:hypothetical protein
MSFMEKQITKKQAWIDTQLRQAQNKGGNNG